MDRYIVNITDEALADMEALYEYIAKKLLARILSGQAGQQQALNTGSVRDAAVNSTCANVRFESESKDSRKQVQGADEWDN